MGIAMLMYGGWLALVNIFQNADYGASWVRPTAIAFGLVGFLAALIFLLSFDGPFPMRSTFLRAAGWIGMVIGLLLPTSLTMFLLPLVAGAAFTIRLKHSVP